MCKERCHVENKSVSKDGCCAVIGRDGMAKINLAMTNGWCVADRRRSKRKEFTQESRSHSVHQGSPQSLCHWTAVQLPEGIDVQAARRDGQDG